MTEDVRACRDKNAASLCLITLLTALLAESGILARRDRYADLPAVLWFLACHVGATDATVLPQTHAMLLHEQRRPTHCEVCATKNASWEGRAAGEKISPQFGQAACNSGKVGSVITWRNTVQQSLHWARVQQNRLRFNPPPTTTP